MLALSEKAQGRLYSAPKNVCSVPPVKKEKKLKNKKILKKSKKKLVKKTYKKKIKALDENDNAM